MKPFRKSLRKILPLAALILVVQALAVVHQVKHDVLGGSDTCAICSVASHSAAPAPVAPAIATVSAYIPVVFAPTFRAPHVVAVQTWHQSRAPPASVL